MEKTTEKLEFLVLMLNGCGRILKYRNEDGKVLEEKFKDYHGVKRINKDNYTVGAKYWSCRIYNSDEDEMEWWDGELPTLGQDGLYVVSTKVRINSRGEVINAYEQWRMALPGDVVAFGINML